VFRVVLSHSSKGYSEAVWQQTTEAFIWALENAFRYFGGVTHTVVIDTFDTLEEAFPVSGPGMLSAVDPHDEHRDLPRAQDRQPHHLDPRLIN
jgi:hypothetical protein